MIEKSLKHLNSDEGLLKAQQVLESVFKDYCVKVSDNYVCAVLRNDLGARYQRIKRVAFQGNSIRALVLR